MNESKPRLVIGEHWRRRIIAASLLFVLLVTGWLVWAPVWNARAAATALNPSPENLHTGNELLSVQVLPADQPLVPVAQPVNAQPFQVIPGTHLTVTKSAAGPFGIDAVGVYNIQVTSQWTDTIVGPITVTDPLPEDYLDPDLVSFNGWDPCGINAQGLLTCIYSSTAGIAPGEALPPIRLEGSVDAGAFPSITNTVRANYTINGEVYVVSDTLSTEVEGADLAVTKTVTPTVASEGEQVRFTVVVGNDGPSGAAGVVVTDVLPTTLDFVSAQASAGQYEASTGLWQVGAIPDQGAVTLTLTTRPANDTRGLTIRNSAAVRSTTTDPDPDNNEDSASLQVSSTTLTGQVTFSDTSKTTPAFAPLEDALIRMVDSQGFIRTTTTSASGWYTLTDTITRTLNPGQANVRVSHPDFYTKTATINLQSGGVTRRDFVLDTPDLAVFKTDGRTTVNPDDVYTYTVSITNTGTFTASYLLITDTWSNYLSFITSTVLITPAGFTTTSRTWEIEDADLGPGDGITFTMRFKMLRPTSSVSIVNTADVFTTREHNLANNVAKDTNTYTRQSGANLTITKSVSPSEANRNDTLTFTIRVTNSGNNSGPASDIEVRDSFSTASSYLDITSATTTIGSASTNNSTRLVVVDIDQLNVNQTATITIRARVKSNVTGTHSFSNQATATYSDASGNRSANSNTVPYRIVGSSSLPDTGWGEVGPRGGHSAAAGKQASGSQNAAPNLFWPTLVIALLVGLAGVASLGYAFWARANQPDWFLWALRTGLMLVAVSLAFGFVAWNFRSQPQPVASRAPAVQPQAALPDPTATEFVIERDPWLPAVYTPEADIEELPDYPVPTPTLPPSDQAQEQQADTSPVNRIVIPALGLDTIVKYVPYDGLTWIISGLQNEIAWMGQTSWPGLGGNTALAGHVTLRSGADGPFRYLEDLEPGAEVKLYTEQNIYTYQVSGKQVVDESDLSVIAPGDTSEITLVTCTDWDQTTRFYLKRLVVSGDLVEVNPLPSSQAQR